MRRVQPLQSPLGGGGGGRHSFTPEGRGGDAGVCLRPRGRAGLRAALSLTPRPVLSPSRPRRLQTVWCDGHRVDGTGHEVGEGEEPGGRDDKKI